MAPNWNYLIRFISEEDGQVHLGEVDAKTYLDVGLSILKGDKVAAQLVAGTIYDGVVTKTVMHVARVCCPKRKLTILQS